MTFGECETRVKFPKIVLTENKRCFVLVNPSLKIFRKIKVDGCAIKDGVRCDYLIIGSDPIEYFIELKGCDIDHALEQLETSIRKIGSKDSKIRRNSYIVCSRVPRETPRIQNLQKVFWEKVHSTLTVKLMFAKFVLTELDNRNN